MYYKQNDVRINTEMIVAYAPESEKVIKVYLLSGHLLDLSFQDEAERDRILSKLDILTDPKDDI